MLAAEPPTMASYGFSLMCELYDPNDAEASLTRVRYRSSFTP